MRLLVGRFYKVKEKLFSSKNLLYTNVAISISLSATGDFLEQHYEILKGEWKKFCGKRNFHMSLSGMSVGILCHYWYRFLDSRVPGKTIGAVLRKVLIDQFICSPLCIAMFFLTLAILERTDWEEFIREVKNKAHRLYIAEWVVWPPAQIINFYFLPTRYRVLYDNCISLGYDVYTSQVKHDNVQNQHK